MAGTSVRYNFAFVYSLLFVFKIVVEFIEVTLVNKIM